MYMKKPFLSPADIPIDDQRYAYAKAKQGIDGV